MSFLKKKLEEVWSQLHIAKRNYPHLLIDMRV